MTTEDISINGSIVRPLCRGCVVMRGKREIYFTGENALQRTRAALEKTSFNRLFNTVKRRGITHPYSRGNRVGYTFETKPARAPENTGSSLFIGGVLVAQHSHSTLTY